jgi:hypothetical protein
MYQLYQDDYDNKIHFKTSKNWQYDPKTDNGRNKNIVDLNEIEVHGKISELARAVADRTKPRLKPSDVENLLKAMSEKSFRPRAGKNQRNGYIRSSYCDDLKQHKGIMMVKKVLTISGYRETLRAYCSEVYLPLLKEMYPEEQVYSVIKESIVSPYEEMVKYLKPQGFPEVNEMLLIVSSFSGVREDQIQDPYATIPNLTMEDCAIILHGFREGKIRKKGDTNNSYIKIGIKMDPTGTEFPKYFTESDIPMLNGVPESEMESPNFKHQMICLVDISAKNKISFSPMAIELFDKSIVLDAFIDATLCATTQPGKRLLGWVHEDDPSKLQTVRLTKEMIDTKVKEMDDDAPDNAELRENGIPFVRRGFLESSSQKFLFGADANLKTSKSIELIHDLDRWAATKQHLICGRPFSEPVRDPKWIRDNYKGPVGNSDYPTDLIREKLMQSAKHWDSNSAAKRKNSKMISKIK